eukprot:3875039-Pleurochrysis_carterae.AAC.2
MQVRSCRRRCQAPVGARVVCARPQAAVWSVLADGAGWAAWAAARALPARATVAAVDGPVGVWR